MRVTYLCIVAALLASVALAGSDVNRVLDLLKSNNYKATAKPARTFDAGAELEIGDGNGHGFSLNWLRFRPMKDKVEVLSIELDRDYEPYRSKWQPDRVSAT